MGWNLPRVDVEQAEVISSVRPAGGMAGRVEAQRNKSNQSVEAFFEFVSFLAGHFEIEHQIFDVESKLSERFLNK